MNDQILKRLAHAREQAGLSQSQVARMFGTDKADINDIETGIHPLSDAMFANMCSAYDVSPQWVLSGKNPNFDRQAVLDKARASGASFDDANRLADLLESLRREGE